MPRYTYSAKTSPHQTIQGDIEAESEQDAVNKLTQKGYFPLSVKAEDLSLDRQGLWRFRKKSSREIATFTRQLATLIESGVNILDGLNIVSSQITNKYFRSVLIDVIAKIKDGSSLSQGLASHPHLFSSLYSAMVHSGEVGGTLEGTLKRLADYLENEEEFKSSVRSALAYPVFVLIVGVATIMVLLGFVIPRLVVMFEDMGQMLPMPTRMLIGLSEFLRSFWWLILAISLFFIFLLRQFYRNPKTRIQMDKVKLKVFLWGNIVLKTEVGRLMRTLSVLISSGIPIVSALDIGSSVVENQVLKVELQKFKERINSGSSFSQCLKASWPFPAFVTNIVTVAEETGNLEKSLLRIADDYEKEVERLLKTLTRLLEPVIILVMGLIVGFIVMSMLLPIFQINLIVR